MKTQSTFNQPTVLANGPIARNDSSLTVVSDNLDKNKNEQRYSHIPFVAMIEKRRDEVLLANNLSESNNSSQYLWVKGIYDDLIEFLSTNSATVSK
jgi:hypothetical protein